jgi:hypothetical protein
MKLRRPMCACALAIAGSLLMLPEGRAGATELSGGVSVGGIVVGAARESCLVAIRFQPGTCAGSTTRMGTIATFTARCYQSRRFAPTPGMTRSLR